MSRQLVIAGGGPPEPSGQSRLVLGWIVFARLLLLDVYAQSIFAGVFLSGKIWGRDAHLANAGILVTIGFVAGVLALITLRNTPGGRRYAISLLGFAVGLTLQYGIGQQIADGERLLWFHIPFGVALIGFSAEMATVARRLGRPVDAR